MVLAPAGLDQAIADRLAAALETTVNDPSYVEFLATKGEVPNVVTGEALAERLRNEYDALAKVAANLGLGQ
jgi:tripartite-type tricarboxylate transporter receptor subunit TctC